MKKLFITFAMALLLTMMVGCANKSEVVLEPFDVTGSFQAYAETENGYAVRVLSEDGILTYDVQYSEKLPDIPVSLVGYKVQCTGQVNPAEGVYYGETYVIVDIPLELQLGYTAEDLMSQSYDYLYRSILTKVDYDYIVDDGGRKYLHHDKASYLNIQDEDTVYEDIVGQYSISDAATNWSSIEYIDKNTKDRYYALNYNDWEHSIVSDIQDCSISFPQGTYTVDEFTLENETVVSISGTMELIPDSYLEYILKRTLYDTEWSADDFSITYIAKFDKDTTLPKFIDVMFTTVEPLTSGAKTVSINALVFSFTGVDFNNTSTTSIPPHAINNAKEVGEYVQPVEVMEQPVYNTVLGISIDEVTPEYMNIVFGDLNDPFNTPAGCDVETILNYAVEVAKTYTVDDLMTAQQNEELTPEQRFVIDNLLFIASYGYTER